MKNLRDEAFCVQLLKGHRGKANQNLLIYTDRFTKPLFVWHEGVT